MTEPDSARERTRLAWRRTVLAMTVVAILGARLAVTRTSPAFAALFVSVTAAAWLAFLALTRRRSIPHAVQLILVYEVLAAFLLLRSR
jgi:uncharacterized membrane protein YidH (DUF202 family)